jgi:hypothetical protein
MLASCHWHRAARAVPAAARDLQGIYLPQGSFCVALGRFGVAGSNIVEVAGVLLFVTMIALLC